MDGEQNSLLEKGKLPNNWSAPTCELYALKQAMELLGGKKGTIDTDSKYAFGVIHTFGKIWKECGLISSRGKELVHERLVLEVLETLGLREEIAVVYIMGHQKGGTSERKGNHLADRLGKGAAEEEEIKMLALVPSGKAEEVQLLVFTKEEEEQLQKLGGERNQEGK